MTTNNPALAELYTMLGVSSTEPTPMPEETIPVPEGLTPPGTPSEPRPERSMMERIGQFIPPELRELGRSIGSTGIAQEFKEDPVETTLEFVGPGADVKVMKESSARVLPRLREGDITGGLADLGIAAASIPMMAIPGSLAGVQKAITRKEVKDITKEDPLFQNIPKVDETIPTDQAIKKLHNLEDDISIKKYYDDLLEDNKYVGKKVARTVEEIKNKRKEVSIKKQTSKDDLANEKITQEKYNDIMEDLNKTTKDLDGRSRVIESAEKLKNKEITSKQHRQVVANVMDDPKILDEVPTPSTPEEMAAALGKKRHKGIIGLNKNLEQGTLTDVRLDIPAYNEHGIYIAAVTPVDGKVMYAPTAILKGPLKEDGTRGFVEFISSSPSSLKIAEGGAKSPFAVMRGEWQNINPKTAVQKSELAKDADSWIQIGFNPDRRGQFYNKITGEPIFKAEEVIQVGEHVLAKNIQKATKTELRKLRVGKENPRMFKKGGSIVERNPNTYNMRAI